MGEVAAPVVSLVCNAVVPLGIRRELSNVSRSLKENFSDVVSRLDRIERRSEGGSNERMGV